MNLENKTLEELLVLYQQSEPQAFTEFFERTSKLVFNYLRVRLSSRAEAEDVMQDTYFRIHRYIMSYDKKKKAITWVMTIAQNAMYDHIKSRMEALLPERFDQSSEPPQVPAPDRLLELKQLASEISHSLSPEDWAIFTDRFVYESSYEEIAVRGKISVINARQRISRILRKLRSNFDTP